MKDTSFTPIYIANVASSQLETDDVLDRFIKNNNFEVYIPTELYMIIMEPILDAEELTEEDDIYEDVFSLLLSAVRVAIEKELGGDTRDPAALSRAVTESLYIKDEHDTFIVMPGEVQDKFRAAPFSLLSLFKRVHSIYVEYFDKNPELLEVLHSFINIRGALGTNELQVARVGRDKDKTEA
jgi:hypothetical protein